MSTPCPLIRHKKMNAAGVARLTSPHTALSLRYDAEGIVAATVLILRADSEKIQLMFNHRNLGTISCRFTRSGREELVPNLLGLSAGEAAVFCLFANIVRDMDLAGAPFAQTADIRGIVIIDEADLHLHVNLQYRVFPELMKLFPKVQFIVTTHSPLFVMGMENAFDGGRFRVIEMPSGEQIQAEAFGGFEHAAAAFLRTRTFDQRILDRIRQAAKPVVLVEGKTDVAHLQAAWEKLNPGTTLPWDIVSCGGMAAPKEDRGGAEMLRTMLRALCLHVERPVLGLFDRDREGMEQFLGLAADGFVKGNDEAHWRHSTQPIHAAILPVPPGRENFVSPKPPSCFLALEHFYSDAVLKQFDIADDPVVPDSAVFRITRSSKKKTKFADGVKVLSESEFANFRALFNRLGELLGTQTEQSSVLASAADILVHQVACSADWTPETTLVNEVGAPALRANHSELGAGVHETDAARLDGPEPRSGGANKT